MNKKFTDKTPTFKTTEIFDPITEFALSILARKDNKFYASGTAIIIGSHLAITAKHVIADLYKRFEKKELIKRNEEGTFNLQAFQIYEKEAQVWNVTRIWTSLFTDIAILFLTPTTKKEKYYNWKIPTIELLPPMIGERIATFGWSNPKVSQDGKEISWSTNSKTSIGEVKQIHNEKRDNAMLNFPCFQTNARFDASMSGGPVFDSKGYLCGIICSNLPPNNKSEEHISYVASLWPLMGTEINLNRKGHPSDINYPLLELAQDGIIRANDWEKISLSKDVKGNIIGISLNKV